MRAWIHGVNELLSALAGWLMFVMMMLLRMKNGIVCGGNMFFVMDHIG